MHHSIVSSYTDRLGKTWTMNHLWGDNLPIVQLLTVPQHYPADDPTKTTAVSIHHADGTSTKFELSSVYHDRILKEKGSSSHV